MKEIREELDILKEKGLYRWLRSIKSEQSSYINLEGKRVLNLSSNNYLGLATHPKVKEALIKATEKYGASASASRLISGNIEIYDELEEKIAKFKGTERALVFSSGYMANIGIISSFVNKDDIIFSDKLNHASIIDGCMLSRAMFKRFPHRDMEKLEELLKDSSKYRRRLIITEGVFSSGYMANIGIISSFVNKDDVIFSDKLNHDNGVFRNQ